MFDAKRLPLARRFVSALLLFGVVLFLMACGVDTGIATISVASSVASSAETQPSTAMPRDLRAAFIAARQREASGANALIATDDAKLLSGEKGALGDELGTAVALNETGDMAIIGAPFDDDQGVDSGAAYIFARNGNSWEQLRKFRAMDGAAAHEFGNSVAFSGDTVIIGAYKDSEKGLESGAAYVFVRSGATWNEEAKLVASDAMANDRFGNSVALSGGTAIVGAALDSDNGLYSGSAYVFVRVGSTWTQQAKLLPNDGAAFDNFGTSVSLSVDTAIVGSVGDADKGTYSGSAYVFVRNGTTWSQQAKLLANDGAAYDWFGYAVGLSGDTVIVGAHRDGDKGIGSGSAYVFVRNGTAWSQQAKLLASDGAGGDWFGFSVAVSGDTAIVGAPLDDDQGFNSGSAYIFVRSGMTWSEQAKVGTGAGEFGHSIAVAGDVAIVGAYKDNVAGALVGSAYTFARSGATWTPQTRLQANDAADDMQLGTSVALSGDSAIVGAYRDGDNGAASGAAYVFVRSGVNWILQAKLTASDGAPYDEFGTSVALSGDTAIVGAPMSAHSGWTYVFVRKGTTWTEQAKLMATDGIAYDLCGNSVSLSGDTAIVGCPRSPDFGSAYVFVRSGTIWTQQAKLLASDGAVDDDFGKSVGLSGDTAIVGAWHDDSGSAYLFVRSGNTWTQQAKVIANDGGTIDEFGHSVALSGDTAIVGAQYNDNEKGLDSGAAYIFFRSGTTWTQQAKLLADDEAEGDAFGVSVALSGDTAIVGSVQDNANGAYSGSAYFFARKDGNWTQQSKFIAHDGSANDVFGTSVTISENGSLAIVGAVGDDDERTNSGAAYVFAVRRNLGFTCAVPIACESGLCVDGVCCNAPCDGPCQACASALQAFGTDGYCGIAKEGTDPGGRCPDSRKDGTNPDPNSCGTDGYCSAVGTCRVYAYDTSCGDSVCVGDQAQGKICNGFGTCTPDPNLENCGPYACQNGACIADCAKDDKNCTPDAFCKTNGQCEIKKNIGQMCGAANECQSGFCVDGVCCNQPCDGACQACSAAAKGSGLDGYCGNVEDMTLDDLCMKDDKNSCGITGTCRAGACEVAAFGAECPEGGVECIANQRYTKKICNGLGACIPDPNSLDPCGAYLCDELTKACKSECTPTDAGPGDCAPGFECKTNICVSTPECRSSEDCKNGRICDVATLRCLPPDSTDDTSENACDCQVPGGSSERNPIAGVLLGLALFHTRRLRRTTCKRSMSRSSEMVQRP